MDYKYGLSFMSIDIKDRIGFLLHSLKKSRKTTTTVLLVAAFVAVLLFVSGSFYFLFRYYESINNVYYESIVKGVYSFQDEIIRRNSYRDDLTRITRTLLKNRGVKQAWVTDRDGRLIFHTDSLVLEDYRARRLPAEYHDSIEKVWQFQDGYPQMKIVPLKGNIPMKGNVPMKGAVFLQRILSLKGLGIQRISFPLYPFGMEDVDFIMGMDVKRFVKLPDHLQLFLPFAGGYIVLSVLLLFLPSFLLIRGKLQSIESQAVFFISRVQAKPSVPEAALEAPGDSDAVQAEPEKVPVAGTAAQKPSPETSSAGTGTVETVPVETVPVENGTVQTAPAEPVTGAHAAAAEEQMHKLEVKEEAKDELKGEGKKEKTGEEVRDESKKDEVNKKGRDAASEEGAQKSAAGKKAVETKPAEGDKMRETFLKLKAINFKKQAVELLFIQANSYIFHSDGVEGTYQFYSQTGKNHFYLAFSSPPGNPDVLYEQIPSLRAGFRRSLKEDVHLKNLLVQYNDLCLARNLLVDLSVIHIDENTKAVEYSSCGRGKAVYLKHGEEEVKTLDLDNPQLGKLRNEDFSAQIEVADIRFDSDDIFVMLPTGAEEIKIDNTDLGSLIGTTIVQDRGLSAQTIGMEVVNQIESLPAEQKRFLPETGFTVLKFL